MINRVGGQGPLPPQRIIEPAATRASGGPVSAAAPVAKIAARADLSSLAGAARDLAKSPPVDAAKVAALRAGIAAGNYKPDPAAIATCMVESDLPRVFKGAR